MKRPDILSTAIAGLIAAVLLLMLVAILDKDNNKSSLYAFVGFIVGVGTQVGVRLAGVS